MYNYSFPTSICCGAGSIKSLAGHLKENNLSRPLIVTDKGLAELNVFSQIPELLTKDGLTPEVFSGIWGNPVESQVMTGVAAYRQAKADSLVAIGGGAAMDSAKSIGLMINHPGQLFDYDEANQKLPIDREIPYLIAVPTTAGTGSEVGRAAVISEDDSKQKKILFHPTLLPKKVFLDPELTLELPANITAATGIDALTHLVEAYLATGYHPMCDALALHGVKMVFESLPKCVRFAAGKDKSQKHIFVRTEMLNASMMGAVAFQKGLGANHSCAHALSTVCDLHHGLANAIMLPHLLKFNAPECKDKMLQLSAAAGNTNKDFIQLVADLNQELNMPANLQEVGVTDKDLNDLVTLAMQDGCHQTNPVQMSNEGFRHIFAQAMV